MMPPRRKQQLPDNIKHEESRESGIGRLQRSVCSKTTYQGIRNCLGLKYTPVEAVWNSITSKGLQQAIA